MDVFRHADVVEKLARAICSELPTETKEANGVPNSRISMKFKLFVEREKASGWRHSKRRDKLQHSS